MSNLRWILPDELLTHSVKVMRPHGESQNEGLALWLGRNDNSVVTITHAVEVFGRGFMTSPLYMRLSMRAMVALTDLADENNVYLAGQIHSHPGHFLELSTLDKAHGMRTDDYLSVVCPHYAQRDVGGLHECGVHTFTQNRYRRLSSAEIEERIQIRSCQLTKLRLEVSP